MEPSLEGIVAYAPPAARRARTSPPLTQRCFLCFMSSLLFDVGEKRTGRGTCRDAPGLVSGGARGASASWRRGQSASFDPWASSVRSADEQRVEWRPQDSLKIRS